ncbi:MAG: hypothetical protein KAJ95_09585 [Gammaproteobacteria bacterium]|nr:hypothetical protein [Gammaproteobacteria bacterium]
MFSAMCIIATPVMAVDKAAAAAQANNPLANMTAFNIHYYNIADLTETDESANQAWLRFAKPFSVGKSDWLFRASLPINSFPFPPDGNKETGVGDLNIFAAYLFDLGNPAISFGLGPQLAMPTATKDQLGSEKWSAGLANVLFNASSPKFQYGYLLTWQHSFTGEDDRADVNFAAFQPFAMYQLSKGYYMRSVGIWAFNLENDNYNIPVGLGIGKVFKKGKTVYNAFVEPQYTVAYEGPGQPKKQIFFGFNMQFY